MTEQRRPGKYPVEMRELWLADLTYVKTHSGWMYRSNLELLLAGARARGWRPGSGADRP